MVVKNTGIVGSPLWRATQTESGQQNPNQVAIQDRTLRPESPTCVTSWLPSCLHSINSTSTSKSERIFDGRIEFLPAGTTTSNKDEANNARYIAKLLHRLFLAEPKPALVVDANMMTPQGMAFIDWFENQGGTLYITEQVQLTAYYQNTLHLQTRLKPHTDIANIAEEMPIIYFGNPNMMNGIFNSDNKTAINALETKWKAGKIPVVITTNTVILPTDIQQHRPARLLALYRELNIDVKQAKAMPAPKSLTTQEVRALAKIAIDQINKADTWQAAMAAMVVFLSKIGSDNSMFLDVGNDAFSLLSYMIQNKIYPKLSPAALHSIFFGAIGDTYSAAYESFNQANNSSNTRKEISPVISGDCASLNGGTFMPSLLQQRNELQHLIAFFVLANGVEDIEDKIVGEKLKDHELPKITGTNETVDTLEKLQRVLSSYINRAEKILTTASISERVTFEEDQETNIIFAEIRTDRIPSEPAADIQFPVNPQRTDLLVTLFKTILDQPEQNILNISDCSFFELVKDLDEACKQVEKDDRYADKIQHHPVPTDQLVFLPKVFSIIGSNEPSIEVVISSSMFPVRFQDTINRILHEPGEKKLLHIIADTPTYTDTLHGLGQPHRTPGRETDRIEKLYDNPPFEDSVLMIKKSDTNFEKKLVDTMQNASTRIIVVRI